MAVSDDSRLPRLLDIESVADSLGVSVRHVRRLVAERRIPFVKWGKLLRFDAAEVARWLDAQRVGARSMSHPLGTIRGTGSTVRLRAVDRGSRRSGASS
jgi:excisionase family DNA binding protein